MSKSQGVALPKQSSSWFTLKMLFLRAAKLKRSGAIQDFASERKSFKNILVYFLDKTLKGLKMPDLLSSLA